MYQHLIKVPLVLNFNRVKRAYTGGKLLDQWQGIEPPSDGQFPEEFLISTVEVTNEDRYPGEGLSKTTLADGSAVALKKIIDSDPVAFLGEPYAEMNAGDLGVLVRIGDTTVRHVIQAHPDTEHAQKYLNFPNGKTETWYIVSTRSINGQQPHTYAGFKPGMTPERWRDLFDRQDVQGMLDSLHRIEISEGDMLLIPAGMPHAMGPGAMFIEVHEPCDYTFRLEKQYLTGRVFTDAEIHYGIGTNNLFKAFHYDTFTDEEILAKVVITPQLLCENSDGAEYALISYEHTDRFAINKIVTSGVYHIAPFPGHAVAVVVKGYGRFVYDGGETAVHQGQGVFLPASISRLQFDGEGKEAELLIAFPPKL